MNARTFDSNGNHIGTLSARNGRTAPWVSSTREVKVGDMLTDYEIGLYTKIDAKHTSGGWVGNVYVCWGCHKDGQCGWQVKEIR